MKIILLKDYPKIGKIGEIKEVAQGFARNFLFPKKIAVLFSSHTAETFQQQLKKKAEKKEVHGKEEEKALALLQGKTWIIRVNANEKGHLFASLHEKDLMEVFLRDKIDIDARQVEIHEPIKSLGNFIVFFKKTDGGKEKIHISVLPVEK